MEFRDDMSRALFILGSAHLDRMNMVAKMMTDDHGRYDILYIFLKVESSGTQRDPLYSSNVTHILALQSEQISNYLIPML